MLLNYHIGRLVLNSLCVGDLVQLVLSGARFAGFSLIEEDVVPGGALNLNSANLPRPWSPWEFSPSRKIPMVEPGIVPRTS